MEQHHLSHCHILSILCSHFRGRGAHPENTDSLVVLENVALLVSLASMVCLEALGPRDHRQIFRNGFISCRFNKGH